MLRTRNKTGGLTKIALDPTRGHALGDTAEPLLRDPGDQHLSRVRLDLFGDRLDLVRIDDPGFPRDIVTERRIRRKVDPLFFAVRLELVLLQTGMSLDLVDRGDDPGGIDDHVQMSL